MTRICLHVKCPIGLPYCKQVWNFSANFIKIPNIKLHVNPSGGIRYDRCEVNRSLIQLQSKKTHIWRFNFAGNRIENVGHHVKDLVFCPIVTKFGCALQVSWKSRVSIFTEIRPVTAALIHTDGWTENGHDEGNKEFRESA